MPSIEKVPNYAKANFDKLRSHMDIDWDVELGNLGAEDSWSFFKEKLSKSIKACIPLKIRCVSNRPLCINQNIMQMIRKKV